MKKYKRLVFTALDSPRRDFEWRLFLASRLSHFGISTAIGAKWAIKRAHLGSRNAILFGRLASSTGRSPKDLEWVNAFEDIGTKWLYFHDEGGIFASGSYDNIVKRAYTERFFSEPYLEKVFFWGERQRAVFSGHPEQDKFEVTGTPRLDLARPENDSIDMDKVSAIRARHGNYTLICSRFPGANKVADEVHALSVRKREIEREAGLTNDIQSPEIIRQQFGRWRKVTHEFANFLTAIVELLIRNPETVFVIRPHPAEAVSVYEAAFSSFPNAFIDKDADVRPLIRGADCVIQSDCTTGLEAAVNGRPVINFRSWKGTMDYDPAGVSEVGEKCSDVSELVDLYRQTMSSGQTKAWDDWSKVTEIIANADPASDPAVDKMARAIASVSDEMPNPTVLDANPPHGNAGYVQRCLSLAKRPVKALIRGRQISIDSDPREGDKKAFDYDRATVLALWQSFGGKGRVRFGNNIVFLEAG